MTVAACASPALMPRRREAPSRSMMSRVRLRPSFETRRAALLRTRIVDVIHFPGRPQADPGSSLDAGLDPGSRFARPGKRQGNRL